MSQFPNNYHNYQHQNQKNQDQEMIIQEGNANDEELQTFNNYEATTTMLNNSTSPLQQYNNQQLDYQNPISYNQNRLNNLNRARNNLAFVDNIQCQDMPQYYDVDRTRGNVMRGRVASFSSTSYDHVNPSQSSGFQSPPSRFNTRSTSFSSTTTTSRFTTLQQQHDAAQLQVDYTSSPTANYLIQNQDKEDKHFNSSMEYEQQYQNLEGLSASSQNVSSSSNSPTFGSSADIQNYYSNIPQTLSPSDALNLGINLEQYISKRNERERCRVKNVNDAFNHLKNSLPIEIDKLSKRVSKVEILRTAINYIKDLEQVLGYKQPHYHFLQQQQHHHHRPQQHQSTNNGQQHIITSQLDLYSPYFH